MSVDQNKDIVSMTTQEKDAMDKLVTFWNAYAALPRTGHDGMSTVCDAVHVIQGVMAIRVARRANPEIWI